MSRSERCNRAWAGAIAAGFAVDVAVAGMLSLLIYLVKRIDDGAADVHQTLQAAEANTAAAELVPQVADAVDAVLAEGLEHHLFLGRALAKVRS